MTRTCDECGAEIPVGSGVRAHDSTGFGAGNEIWSSYCSRRCRAAARGNDAILAVTQQATLELFTGDGVRSSNPDAIIAWSV